MARAFDAGVHGACKLDVGLAATRVVTRGEELDGKATALLGHQGANGTGEHVRRGVDRKHETGSAVLDGAVTHGMSLPVDGNGSDCIGDMGSGHLSAGRARTARTAMPTDAAARLGVQT